MNVPFKTNSVSIYVLTKMARTPAVVMMDSKRRDLCAMVNKIIPKFHSVVSPVHRVLYRGGAPWDLPPPPMILKVMTSKRAVVLNASDGNLGAVSLAAKTHRI